MIIENVGNLVCPAEFDTGALKNVMILSVPEGDDKPLKYPLMFSVCDVLLINKIDYLSLSDFDRDARPGAGPAAEPEASRSSRSRPRRAKGSRSGPPGWSVRRS